jgi:IclR family transcriptional regulator, pca regulon regulatory protein
MRLLSDPGIDLSHSLSRGLLILECFTTRQPRLSTSEIQKLTNMPRASLFRLLKILKGFGYLKHDEESKKYFLGPSVLRMGFSVLHSLEAREIARPYLGTLSRQFNKSIGLLMLDDNEMVYVERVRVPSVRVFNLNVGDRIAVYPTAAGKAVLAYLDEEKMAQMLDELKREEKVDVGENGEKLFASLAEVRQQGYSINNEEVYKGVRAIAVPIFSSEGVVYSVNVAVPPDEVSVDELRNAYAPELVTVGKTISELLGYQNEKRFRNQQQ